jgi:protein CpxP
MKRTLLVIGTTTALTLAAFSHASGWHHKNHHQHERIIKQLQLSEEQTMEFNSIHEHMHKSIQAPIKHYVMPAIFDLNPANTDYSSQVEALAAMKAEEVRQAVLEMAETHAKIHALLTPEQREKAKELRAEMKEKKQAKHHQHKSHRD